MAGRQQQRRRQGTAALDGRATAGQDDGSRARREGGGRAGQRQDGGWAGRRLRAGRRNGKTAGRRLQDRAAASDGGGVAGQGVST